MPTSLRQLPFPLLGLVLVCLLACGNGDAASSADAADAADATTSTPETSVVTKADLPKVISQGDRVDLADHLDSGRTTVFDFTSEGCPPCRQISPYLDKLHGARDDVAVVKIDVNRPGQRGIDWGSPVMRQYGLNSLPHFKVFDAEGALLAEGRPAWNMVVEWINEVIQAEQASAGSM